MVKKNEGYLVIVVAILLVVIGGFAVSFVSSLSSTANSQIEITTANSAFNLAQSGLEMGNYQLSLGNCSSTWTTVPQTPGQYRYNCTPYDATTTLSGGINNSATTLTLSSAAGFANYGSVRIDSEVIYYENISGNILQNLRRGQNGTIAASHSNGATTSQNQYIVGGQGGVPTIAAPTGLSTLYNAVLANFTANYYAVGNNGSRAIILKYDNNNNWSTVTTGPSGVTLYDIDMSSAYGVAVGYASFLALNTKYSVFDSSSWSSITDLPSFLTVLGAISCDPVNPTDCWAGGRLVTAVGASLGAQLYHNGSLFPIGALFQFSSISCNSGYCLAAGSLFSYYYSISSTSPLASVMTLSGLYGNANAAFCAGINNCMLVTSAGWAYYFNGAFQGPYKISNFSLNGVHCPSTGSCKVVGSSSAIYNCTLPLTGSGSCVQEPVAGSINLQDVHCNSTSDCLAVGLSSNRAYRYTLGNWTRITMPASYNLYGVSGINGSTGLITPTVWRNR